MSAADLDNPISYHQLEDIEDDFEDVELELRKSPDTYFFPIASLQDPNRALLFGVWPAADRLLYRPAAGASYIHTHKKNPFHTCQEAYRAN